MGPAISSTMLKSHPPGHEEKKMTVTIRRSNHKSARNQFPNLHLDSTSGSKMISHPSVTKLDYLDLELSKSPTTDLAIQL